MITIFYVFFVGFDRAQAIGLSSISLIGVFRKIDVLQALVFQTYIMKRDWLRLYSIVTVYFRLQVMIP
jgi:hypothetical protein